MEDFSQLAEQTLLPKKFLERLYLQYPKQFDYFLQNFYRRLPVVRVNTLLTSLQEIEYILAKRKIEYILVPALENSMQILNLERKAITEMDIYQEGKIYIQSVASMRIVDALKPQPGEKILDMCAAPGSKTTQIAIYMQKQGELIANDKKGKRCKRLTNVLNLQKVDDFVQVKNYPGQNYPHYYPEYFDAVLVDTTCSSESRFVSGKENSLHYWSHHKVKTNSRLQKKLLLAALKCVVPGGRVLYSTCTISPQENEAVLDFILRKNPHICIVSTDKKGVKTLPPHKEWAGKTFNPQVEKATRLLPDEFQECFFYACLKKTA